ncbi:MAG: hypothetical protein ACOCP8_05180 [archaeon]
MSEKENNKKLKSFFILTIVIVLIIGGFLTLQFTSNNTSYDTPKETVNTVYTAINDDDVETVYEAHSKKIQEKMSIEEIENSVLFQEDLTYKVENMKVEKNDNTAQVKITQKISGKIEGEKYNETSDTTLDLIKENQKWKINVSF